MMEVFLLTAYSNPYFDKTIMGFFLQFLKRVIGFARGDLGFADLATDEIQVLVLIGVAASSAFVGSFLVLRRMTMLANSLSHTILLGIVMTYVFTRDGMLGSETHSGTINIQMMLAAALIMGIVTTFLTQFLTHAARLQEDASTALVFTTLFALGIILVTVLTRNAHIGAEVVMGNVDALHFDDCKLIYTILGINLFLFTIFFKEFKITTFDPGLAQAFGISTVFFNYLLMIQVSGTVVGAFRAVGVLMILAFITGPVLTARLLTHSLKTMIFFALVIGSLASLIGVAFSRHLLTVYEIALSTSGVVVCVIVLFYLLALLFAPGQGLIFRQRQRLKV